MDFGVLGALSVVADDGHIVALGGPIQRRLLAALIAHAPQAAPVETLVHDVWGDSAPATAVRTLHSHVARLRVALSRDSARAIETVDGRYRLPLQRADLDAWIFEDLVREATNGGHAPAEASTLLRRALQIWRGPAYEEFLGASFADVESRRLESLRESALESAIDADLAAGKGAALLPELEALVVEYPFRERLWAALVIALYRAGRQAEALDAYQRARALLGEELGVDPGPELRAVEAKVLAHDPSLVASTTRVLSCPWKGLASYEPGDVDFFVGRDRVISEVIARLIDYSVVIVTGPSGSGKSSLVRAGVIPALAAGTIIGSADWRVRLLTPGVSPLDAVRSGVGDAPDVLIIDPGDDLLAVSGAHQVGSIAEILRVAVAGGMRLVMTLRGDLFGRLTELNELAPHAGAGTVLVGPPSDRELRQVVELPAARVGLEVEPALVDAVVADVIGRPGSLPLMSTALVRTWERREDDRLTLAGYIAAGGTSSALERLAEEAYALMSDHERASARRILLRLVVNDDGVWRRRSTPLDDLGSDSDAAAVRALIVLSDHRLVSLDVGVVQLSHEALTSAWPRFASWLAEREQGSAVFDHLVTSSRAWESGGRDDGDLYRGTRLQAALDLESTQPYDLGALEHEFIARSRDASGREVSNLRRGRRRLMLVAVGLVILLLFSSLAGALAIRSRNDAAQAALEADAQRVGLQALSRSDVKQKLLLAVAAVRMANDAGTRASLLNAIQSGTADATTLPLLAPVRSIAVSGDGWVGVTESNGWTEDFDPDLTPEDPEDPAAAWSKGTVTGGLSWMSGHGSMLIGAANPPRVFSFNPHNGGAATFSSDWLPSTFAATRNGVWAVGVSSSMGSPQAPVLTGRRVEASNSAVEVKVPLQRPVRAMVGGPGSTVSVVEAGAVESVDMDKGEVVDSVRVPMDAIVEAAADGRHAAMATTSGDIEIVDLASGMESKRIPRVPAPLGQLALSADGSLLAGGNAGDGVIHVWDTRTGIERARFQSTLGAVHAMAWTDSGTRLITAPTGIRALQAWDLSTFVSIARQVFPASPDGVGETTAIDIDRVGRLLGVGTARGRVWFLGLDSGVAKSSAPPNGAPIVSLAFADRGRLAVTADSDGVLTVWDVASAAPVRQLTGRALVDPGNSEARAPVASDGRTAASFTDGYGLRLIDVVSGTAGSPVYPELGDQVHYQVLGWTPDDRYVVVAAQGVSFSTQNAGVSSGVWALVDPHDRSVRWRTQAPEQAFASTIAFVDHARTIVLAGRSGRLYFVDVATGTLLQNGGAATVRPLAVNERQSPASLSVSPDGSRLSVVSAEHPAEILDVASGQQSGSIDMPAGTTSATFLSDGELASVTTDGEVSVYDLRVSDWVDRACSAAGRDLTPQEWSLFLPAQAYRHVCESVRQG